MAKQAFEMQEREVMDVRQAAKYLGIAPDTLYLYAKTGFIPAFKLGNRWRFKRSHLNDWMDKKAHSLQNLDDTFRPLTRD